MDNGNLKYSVDKQSFITVSNETVINIGQIFLNMVEYTAEELINKNISEVFGILKVGSGTVLENVDKSDRECFLFTKSLEVRFVSIHVLKDNKEIIYFFTEKPCSRIEEKFKYICQLCTDNMAGIAIYTVPDLILLKASQRYLDTFDEPNNKLVNTAGKKIYEIITGWKGSEAEDVFRRVISTGKSMQVKEYCHNDFKRGTAYIDADISPILEEGKVKYIVSKTTEVTDIVISREYLKKQSEMVESQNKLLLQSEYEKNEALEKAIEMKDEFLSIISHEFRTPLTIISTAVQTLNSIYYDDLSDKVKKYLDTIEQNTLRQLRLVNNLLDITRAKARHIKINKKNIDIVFLTKAITESVYTFALQKGVSLSFESSISKEVIGIDDEKYERILLNLLSNAIKFTPAGKSINVKLRSTKNNICIEVKDNGIGVPAEKINVIFERFGQVDSSLSRQAEGTGIGLSLVKEFVEALDGSISVTSKLGKGSVFTILLPKGKVTEEHYEKYSVDLIEDRLIQTINVEFSDIYL